VTATANRSGTRKGHGLWFVGPRQAEIRTEDVPEPIGNQIAVEGLVSLVSAGTEMLIYRGEANPDEDLGLETARGSFSFPVKYAYQTVGKVVARGEKAVPKIGDIVFCRHPHQDYFTMAGEGWLIAPVPDGIVPERAVFMNLLGVALNSQLDVPTRLGDVIAVFGQGLVGSFCAQLARRTAGKVVVIDPIQIRREEAIKWGADMALDPAHAKEGILEASEGRGADICIEATGVPSALQTAIESTGQEGTIIAISFFGKRVVPLILSPEFHYRRLRLISSQVSSLGSGLQPRWSFARRDAAAFDVLAHDWLVTPVTHRLPFDRAPEAYTILDQHPEDALGILLEHRRT
jgi:2-desacetyl-2-hydroxyethyl bacteriochlorophyllide A dehydrogenase